MLEVESIVASALEAWKSEEKVEVSTETYQTDQEVCKEYEAFTILYRLLTIQSRYIPRLF